MKIQVKKRLGALAVVVALTGAFATQAMAERSELATDQQGYERVNGNQMECEPHDICTTINTGPLCTVDLDPANAQLFGLDDAQRCTVVLYRPNQ